jgi:peroxiredoxin
VDFPDASRAFGEKLGLTYPLLSDLQRTMLRAYGALNEDQAMITTPRINQFLRAKRSWFVIDKQGIIRFMKIDSNEFVPNDEMIDVVKKYQ